MVVGLVTLQSGVPVAVTQTTNFNAFAGFGTQRPNLVGRSDAAGRPAHRRALVQHAAFAIAPQFTIGSASRNPVRGPVVPGCGSLGRPPGADHGGQSLEFRAEIFNLLNTVNLGAPAAVAGAANFGTITTALDPRVVQLAVKYVF